MLTKPLHLAKLRKRISKRTGKVSYRVETSKTIKYLYEYEDMTDFVSTSGTKIIYGEDRFGL
jgi:hypothetical protein